MTTKKNIEKINIDEDVLFDNDISQLLLSLDNKIRSGEFKIAIYGLGHVGSPLRNGWNGGCRSELLTPDDGGRLGVEPEDAERQGIDVVDAGQTAGFHGRADRRITESDAQDP